MRSRLEAKWAAFWDEEAESSWRDNGLSISWEYEPSAFASGQRQYLPDFCITFDAPPYVHYRYYLEIKPFVPDDPSKLTELMEAMEVIFESDPHCELGIGIGDPYQGGDLRFECSSYSSLDWNKWYDMDAPGPVEKNVVRVCPVPAWYREFQSSLEARVLVQNRSWAVLAGAKIAWFNAHGGRA